MSVSALTVLVIPGLNGHPGLLMDSAPSLFPGFEAIAFSHHVDLAEGGVEGLAERAFSVLEHEQPNGEPVVVAGESFGGPVALTMARQHPERVKGLILLSTFGRYPSTLARKSVGAMAVWSFLGSRVNGPTYQVGRYVSVPGQLGLRVTPDMLKSYISRPRAHAAAYRAKAELSVAFDARPWLASLTCPTFVMTGTMDPVVAPSAGRELARLLPHAELHTLPGGHLVHIVQAGRAGALIADWAAREVQRPTALDTV
jgi:pimeloyl-ACP methyl ester carboxylesterase